MKRHLLTAACATLFVAGCSNSSFKGSNGSSKRPASAPATPEGGPTVDPNDPNAAALAMPIVPVFTTRLYKESDNPKLVGPLTNDLDYSDWLEVPATAAIPAIKMAQNGQINIKFAGNFNWDDLKANNTSVCNLATVKFQTRILVSRDGGATFSDERSSEGLPVLNEGTDLSFDLGTAVLKGDSIVPKVLVRFAEDEVKQGDCISKYTVVGALDVDVVPADPKQLAVEPIKGYGEVPHELATVIQRDIEQSLSNVAFDNTPNNSSDGFDVALGQAFPNLKFEVPLQVRATFSGTIEIEGCSDSVKLVSKVIQVGHTDVDYSVIVVPGTAQVLAPTQPILLQKDTDMGLKFKVAFKPNKNGQTNCITKATVRGKGQIKLYPANESGL